jgi:hypothetical protein
MARMRGNSAIRAGRRTPHPRHFAALAKPAGVPASKALRVLAEEPRLDLQDLVSRCGQLAGELVGGHDRNRGQRCIALCRGRAEPLDGSHVCRSSRRHAHSNPAKRRRELG